MKEESDIRPYSMTQQTEQSEQKLGSPGRMTHIAWHILHDSGVEADEGIQLLVCIAMTRLVILRARKGGFAVPFAKVGM